MQMVPSEGVIAFLRTFSFGNAYRQDVMNPLYEFIDLRGGPEHEFIDSELEQLRKGLRGAIQTFLAPPPPDGRHRKRSGVVIGPDIDKPRVAPDVVDAIGIGTSGVGKSCPRTFLGRFAGSHCWPALL